ncbi:exosortase E/protease, VPEID-CTERM system [Roseovarius aestuariivivens]|uniref:exosortase E/protease, VPEID-CTERM system n=1 Tax=Roseovarius aestuariivivens TaxID=1888910 RepID=UPI0010807D7C|nr:exosortase E/protease, VPEID-CTERM system [Roseovarius aestuariivivens]
MSLAKTSSKPVQIPWPWVLAGVVLMGELLVLWILYDEGFEFTCRDALPEAYCAFAGHIVPRALGVLAVLSVGALAWPSLLRPLLTNGKPQTVPGMGLNLLGFSLILAPFSWVSDAAGSFAVTMAALMWSVGGILAAVGICLMVTPARGWRDLLSKSWLLLGILTAVGLVLPEVTTQLFAWSYPLWHTGQVTEWTFAAVVSVLLVFGYTLETDPSIQLISANDFAVLVGPQCSGVEGFLLITVFLTVYLILFRKDLRFPHVLLLYPLGLGISWLFNVARISVLLAIGADISPSLAVGGFHSHAGWLTFTALSIALIGLSRFVPFFTTHEFRQAPTGSSIFKDPVAARILPFIVFMLSALLLSTFSQNPSLYYPVRVLALTAIILAFWPIYRSLPWRPSPEALLAGLAIGMLWILIPASDGSVQPYGDLAGLSLAAWFLLRGIGTIMLVPIVEELFFRDYLEGRLRLREGRGWVVFAALLSAAAFAALHDRWAEAFVAALVFSWVFRRSGRITDAIVAHAVANGAIFAFAVLSGRMHII